MECRRNILQVGNTNNQNHHKTKAWKEVAEVVNASNSEGAKRLPPGCRKRWTVSMEMDIVLHYSHVGQIEIYRDNSVIAYLSTQRGLGLLSGLLHKVNSCRGERWRKGKHLKYFVWQEYQPWCK